MAKAVITNEFASARETAAVLGVSRTDTEKLIQMAKGSIASHRHGKNKAKQNRAKAIGKKPRLQRCSFP